MPREYRTIQEVAGPLMLVRGVENVAFSELAEIELANGRGALPRAGIEGKRMSALEADGINISTARSA